MSQTPTIPAGSGANAAPRFDPASVHRPDPALMRYYLIVSLLTGPGFPIVLLASWFRYSTLRYRLDQEGIWMGCGVLFKNEVNLAYRRIQDIHLTRNFIQRWMGLATVSVQTASGSATAEMTIEGILSAEELRDYLYVKMRGARGLDHGLDHGPGHPPDRTHPNADAAGSSSPADEALVLLREIRDALQARPHTDPHRPTSQEDRA